MHSITDPAAYEAWYHTPRGRWIGDREFTLLGDLLNPVVGASLLDVGCGTGHFSRRFAGLGLEVSGLDPDSLALAYAAGEDGDITYLRGDGRALPFADNQFDYSSAVTSLCFVDDPVVALREMWRVTRHAVVLGLLNRHSLLYREKQGRGAYRGARWDSAKAIREEWIPRLTPSPVAVSMGSAIFLPRGDRFARIAETWLPRQIPWGGFLAVCLRR
ncbi:class I SAM-dependent methyltransferase [Sedimenticola hydrogenitrophicus]|uniref:class I SAM-dependent methyltransferase n=1 Tax=Sedimenticola hydrogenitrophicus TaxID=2967975 RepID=UPI0023AF7E84|nr:class I SAM-dependent methyltransferase [Sedimenticola hydrogenitrophicus]